MAYEKITDAELVDKGVVGLPDTPGLRTEEMQRKFDEIALDVIVPKYNALIDSVQNVLVDDETQIPNAHAVVEAMGEGGMGDMLRATYDPDHDGSVEKADDSDTLEGHAADYFATADMAAAIEQSVTDTNTRIDNLRYIHITVNYSEFYNGKTITAKCGDEEVTFTGDTTLVKTINVATLGTWVISYVDDDYNFSTSVDIQYYGKYETTLEGGPTVGYTQWLEAGGVTQTFDSLESVLASEVTVRRLMTIHASVDYLVSWYATDNSILNTFVASANALKWIGLRDYACDKLLAIAEWKTAMLGSENWEYILTDKVPTMTSDSAPYGSVICDSIYSTFYGWKVFDGIDNTDDKWHSNGTVPCYIGYRFTNPINVKRLSVKAQDAITYKVQGSNDNSTWTDLSETKVTSKTSVDTIDLANDNFYMYYRLYITSTDNVDGTKKYARIISLQFYGRTLSVSVPTMTSNTAPWGECIYSTEVPTSQDPNAGRAYLAFNNVITSDLTNFWMSSATQANQYVGYKFAKPIVCKKFAIYPFYWSNAKSSVEISVNASNDGNTWTELLHRTITQSNAYQYYDLDNDTEYQYYMCKYVTTSQTDNYTICREIQFYGTDYSEREFASGSTMKYLYDHGVIADGMSIVSNDAHIHSGANGSTPTVTTAPLLVYHQTTASGKNGGEGNAHFSNPVDVSNYKALKATLKEYKGNQYGYVEMEVVSSAPTSGVYSIDGGVHIADMEVVIPKETYLDISSINGSKYIALLGSASGASGDTFETTIETIELLG